jgi:predicted nucleotidyltransferase
VDHAKLKPPVRSASRNRTRQRISKRAIHAVAHKIVEKFDPERIILFGSYAYGNPRPYSDVDLLVVLETSERPLAKQIEIARALSPHPFGMDILVRSPKQLRERIAMGDKFLREITVNGQVLYERARR